MYVVSGFHTENCPNNLNLILFISPTLSLILRFIYSSFSINFTEEAFSWAKINIIHTYPCIVFLACLSEKSRHAFSCDLFSVSSPVPLVHRKETNGSVLFQLYYYFMFVNYSQQYWRMAFNCAVLNSVLTGECEVAMIFSFVKGG